MPFSPPSIVQVPIAGGRFENLIDIMDPTMVAGGAALTAAQLYAIQFRFPKSGRCTHIQYYVTTTASSNIDLGIYDTTATGLYATGSPGTQLRFLRGTGSTALVGNNTLATVALSTPLDVVTRKDYWIVLVSDGTGQLARMPAIAALCTYGLRTAQKASVGTIPLSSNHATIDTWGSGSLTPWVRPILA